MDVIFNCTYTIVLFQGFFYYFLCCFFQFANLLIFFSCVITISKLCLIFIFYSIFHQFWCSNFKPMFSSYLFLFPRTFSAAILIAFTVLFHFSPTFATVSTYPNILFNLLWYKVLILSSLNKYTLKTTSFVFSLVNFFFLFYLVYISFQLLLGNNPILCHIL